MCDAPCGGRGSLMPLTILYDFFLKAIKQKKLKKLKNIPLKVKREVPVVTHQQITTSTTPWL